MTKYSVRAPDGHTYSIEGPEGATDEEVIAEIMRQNPQIGGGAPSPEENEAAPSADPRQTVMVQGTGVKDDFRFDPKVEAELNAAIENTSLSPEAVNDLVKQRQVEAGQAPLGFKGNYVEQLNAYRAARAKGAPAVSVSYAPFAADIPSTVKPTVAPKETKSEPLPLALAPTTAILNDIVRGYQEAVQYGTPGFLAREYYDLTDYGKDQLRQRYPNATDDQIEQMADALIAQTQKGIREANAAETANDSTIPHFVGMLPGSAGIEDFVPGGEAASIAQRTGRAIAQNAAADAAYQGVDIHQGVQDEYNPEQTVAAGAMGGAFHLGIEGVHALASTKGGHDRAASDAADTAARYDARVDHYIQSSGKKPTKPVREQAAAQAVADHINDVTEGWKNAPEFEVHQDFSKLPVGDKEALGMIDDSGKVVLNLKAIKEEAKDTGKTVPEVATAVMYHEALGHHGMTQQFGEDLDTILERMYDEGPSFKNKVDAWLKRNPSAYPDHPNRIARAADEVLAEMSEKGQMPASIINRFKNYIKGTARKMGIKWDYTNREIDTILGMAHRGVIDGIVPSHEGGFVGSRYMSPNRERAFMEYVQAQNLRPAKLFDELERGDNPEAEASIRAREAQLAGRPQPEPVSEDFPVGSTDNRKQVDLINKADQEPGKLHTALMWPHDQSIVDFRYVDPETRAATYGAFRRNGDAAEGLEIYGEGRNSVGPKVVQTIRRQMKEQFPEIKKVEAVRISGARNKGQEVSYHEGKPVEVELSRYMKRKSKDVSNDDIFESENALDTLRAITEDYEPVVMSMDELRREAEMRGLSPDRLLKNKALDLGELPRRFIMQDIAAEKLNDKVTKLWHKIQSGQGTYKDRVAHSQALLKYKELSARIFDEQGEAGRLLRVIQELQYTKKKVTGIRDALDEFTADQLHEILQDPDAYMRFAKSIQDQIDEAKTAVKQGKFGEKLANVLNIPRALMSSVDLSAPFRQGIFLVGRPEFWKSLGPMLKYFASEGAFNNLMADITKRNTYPLMVDSGLAFSGRTGKLSSREEAFQSELAHKIPALGRLVTASERAYNGFLNKLRADVFDNLLADAEKQGVKTNDKFNKSLGSFINHATGRGNLGGVLNSAAPLLNSLFFSPRLIASRAQLLNPQYYISLDPFVRRQAIKSLISATGFVATVLALGAYGGAEVEPDPRSTNFGKIQVGDTRYDIPGGFAQYITLGARLATGQEKNALGDVKDYGNKFGQKTRLDALATFLENKAAPVPSFILDALRGTDAVGKPFKLQDAATSRFIPMFAQDYMDVAKEYGYGEGALRAAPGVFGFGIQNYKPTAADPDAPIEAPDSFQMQELDDGENDLISVKDGTVTLKGKAKAEWQRRLAFYSKEWMKDEMADPKWKKMSVKEQAEVIKSVHNDARKQTKEDMLPLLGLDGEDTIEEDTTNAENAN